MIYIFSNKLISHRAVRGVYIYIIRKTEPFDGNSRLTSLADLPKSRKVSAVTELLETGLAILVHEVKILSLSAMLLERIARVNLHMLLITHSILTDYTHTK